MTKLLDRYVARQFLGTFVVLVLGLPLLFIITDITDNLDRYIARGLPWRAVTLSYLYQIPLFVLYAFPIAALVGTVFTIGNMTRHQEISAAKAGGVSFYRLIRPIVMLGVVLSAAALGLGELVPETNRLRAEVLGERQTATSTRSNFVFQTEEGPVLSVRRLDPEAAQMTGVVVEREANDTLPALHQTADRAQWTPEEGWRLENGYLRLIDDSGGEYTFSFASSRLPTLRETPEELLAEPKEPDQMRYREMSRFIAAIQRSGGDPRPMLVEREQKIALPLAVLVIVLFGAPLATSSKRGGAAYGIGISLAITMIYLLLFRVGRAMGSSGTLDPMVAAWMPNALFFVAGLILLWRVRT